MRQTGSPVRADRVEHGGGKLTVVTPAFRVDVALAIRGGPAA